MARRQPAGKDIRGGAPTSTTSTSPTSDRDTLRKSDEGSREARGLGGAGFGVVDILRVLAGGILLSFALSWVVTGESVLWGWRPWFTRLGDVQAYMVCIIACPTDKTLLLTADREAHYGLLMNN